AIGVAVDYSASSKNALRWAIDNPLDHGETLLVLHVLSDEGDESKNQLWSSSGSPELRPPSASSPTVYTTLIPLVEFWDPEVLKGYGLELDADVLDALDTVARQKEAKIMAKLYWGDAREKLCDVVEDLKPDSLVMGNRGLTTLQR
ncbi:hypothetical protein Taro_039748, partial [Colocasia esculenta]|nr:hypothetical protein [Colocasia esculenta]